MGVAVAEGFDIDEIGADAEADAPAFDEFGGIAATFILNLTVKQSFTAHRRAKPIFLRLRRQMSGSGYALPVNIPKEFRRLRASIYWQLI